MPAWKRPIAVRKREQIAIPGGGEGRRSAPARGAREGGGSGAGVLLDEQLHSCQPELHYAWIALPIPCIFA